MRFPNRIGLFLLSILSFTELLFDVNDEGFVNDLVRLGNRTYRIGLGRSGQSADDIPKSCACRHHREHVLLFIDNKVNDDRTVVNPFCLQ